MAFRFSRESIVDIIVIDPPVFSDSRGFFMETYKRSEFAAHGIAEIFVQINQSQSLRGTLRGLHYQNRPKAQGKLIRTLSGEIYDVAVDIRKGSSTFSKWVAFALSAESKRMLYIPPGFAHGFCVTSESAEVQYLTTEEYAPEVEAGVIWNDPDLSIDWPISEPILSVRDRSWPRLRDADNSFT
jgi:dTDP-4-dehydrorhamnose 3,5-epimerase